MTDKPIKATLDNTTDECKTQKPILIQLDDIPTPTEDDAGKVLGVDDEGKYALTEGGGGGGGGGLLIIGFNESDSLNKSYNEILEAFQNNIPIVLSANTQNLFMYIPSVIIPGENKIHMEFTTFGYNSTNNNAQLQVMKFDYNSDNTMSAMSFEGYSIQTTPLS